MSVLITGANGGLGTAVSKAFEDSGATVIGVARHWPEPAPFLTLSVDLTTAEGCDSMVEQALKHGPIDALVHLLGGFGGGQPIAETSDKTWDGMMALNLRAAFCAMRAVLKPMRAAKYGRIVAAGARAAVEPMPNYAAYSVSKAGLVALVKNVAAETKDLGITANIVLPSTIDTPLNRQAIPNSDFSRWVQPESIAKALVWLASREAGDVSGAVIPIYGRA
ncbi:MAG TPA: SDR family NAD(P)-dependent oxidoreductase [Bryobacteraceae bacterium]|jgi:NAD(P)-dependent dehydrogenase (short-subunit alcohol dehydrogenase family)|nr:SDR family NAD(P)-dependent oxidoreductase [Bryobacteraceae bacterium]